MLPAAGSSRSADACSSASARRANPSSKSRTGYRETRSRASTAPIGRTSVRQPDSSWSRRARSMSWRSRTACAAASRSDSRTPSGRFSSTDCAKRPSRRPARRTSHARIGVSGTSPTPPPSSSARDSPPASSDIATAARAATVRRSNTSRGVTDSPAAFARATSWIDMMLSPPRSKNESSTPTVSKPSTSAKTRTRAVSAGVAGGRVADTSAPTAGSGNAARSSLPCTVIGIRASTVMWRGTMYDGNRAATMSCNRAVSTSAPAAGTTYATNRSPRRPTPRTSATTCATAGCCVSTASISPSSIR